MAAQGSLAAGHGADPPDKIRDNARSMPLHRVRFVDWAPSSITALAFLPSSSLRPSNARSMLAIGRENGNIDLCVWVEDDTEIEGEQNAAATSSSSAPTRVAQGWMVDTTLIGNGTSKVESLAFVQAHSVPSFMPRLFSTSGGASVTEHFLPLHLLSHGKASTSIFASSPIANSTRAGTSRTIASNGGSVWSMAASPLGKALAIGCDDGHVRIVDIEDGRFELLVPSRAAKRSGSGTISGLAAVLDRAKTRIVSLAWGPPQRRDSSNRRAQEAINDGTDSDDSDNDDDDWEDSFIIAGTTHSSAIIWSTTTGRIDARLLVDKTRKEQTIVWSVATLADGTCILGDSLGHVSFFDGRTRTLLPGGKFAAHGKRADVLCLCIGPDGKSVYSASVDQKVCEYALVNGKGNKTDSSENVSPSRWILTGRRRLHAHDIRAVAIDPPYNPRSSTSSGLLPVLVSGGTDFNVVMTPASSPSSLAALPSPAHGRRALQAKTKRANAALDAINPISTTPMTTFSDTVQRRMPFVPVNGKGSSMSGGGVVRVCAQLRWIVLRREKSIAIWKLPATPDGPSAEVGSAAEWKKIIEMQIKTASNLVCVEISPDGRFLVVSDLYETKLFELPTHTAEDDIVPRRVKSFGKIFEGQHLSHCPGSSAATFTADSRRVIMASHPGSFVHVVELPRPNSTDKCVLLKSFDEHRMRSLGSRVVTGRRGKSDIRANGSSHAVEDASSDEDESSDEEVKKQNRTIFERIDTVVTSPDGQYLVSVDTAKRIHTYSLDTLHYAAPLPSPSQRPSALVFDPWRPNRLTLVLPTNQLIVYDIEARSSERAGSKNRSLTLRRESNGINGSHAQPQLANHVDDGFAVVIADKIRGTREGAIGAVWLSPNVFTVWGSTWMCTARHVAVEHGERQTDGAQQAAKRARDGDVAASTTNTANGKSRAAPLGNRWKAQQTFKYQPLLHVGTARAIDAGTAGNQAELVVIERPYYDVARNLPPTYFGGTPYGA